MSTSSTRRRPRQSPPRRSGKRPAAGVVVWEARPRWRMARRGVIAFGPGKADLLEAIAKHGSISAAAMALGMSYRRAWVLVATMNASFARPLVRTSARRRAGASLTADGRAVLALYRRIEKRSLAATRRDLAELTSRLRPA